VPAGGRRPLNHGDAIIGEIVNATIGAIMLLFVVRRIKR
jgi:uncharacterized membrane protein YeaQ/YmgE (transglycosylase-associated protein family)